MANRVVVYKCLASQLFNLWCRLLKEIHLNDSLRSITLSPVSLPGFNFLRRVADLIIKGYLYLKRGPGGAGQGEAGTGLRVTYHNYYVLFNQSFM